MTSSHNQFANYSPHHHLFGISGLVFHKKSRHGSFDFSPIFNRNRKRKKRGQQIFPFQKTRSEKLTLADAKRIPGVFNSATHSELPRTIENREFIIQLVTGETKIFPGCTHQLFAEIVDSSSKTYRVMRSILLQCSIM